MTPSVLLPPRDLVVDPGAATSTELRVRNTSDIVDEFRFEPCEGDAADWITIEPASVRLFPDTDTVVTVTIAPPREPTTKPGPCAWAVKTIPQRHPESSVVAEGTVVVGTFTDLSAELQPAARSARLRGRFELAVDNRGNVPLTTHVAGTDSDQTLAFAIAPASFDARPGTATFSRIRVKQVDRMWRGQPKAHPFQVLVSAQPVLAGGGDLAEMPAAAPVVAPVVLTGTFVQEPLLPKWLLKAVLLGGALLLTLFVLWKTVLKPTFESAAREVALEEVDEVVEESIGEVVEEEIGDLAAQVEEQAQQAEETAQAVDAVAEDVEAVDEKVEEVEEVVEADPAGPGSGSAFDASNPTNFRLTVAATPGSSSSSASPANAEDVTFALTDFVLQNPGRASGRLRVLIAGEPILESSLDNFLDLDFHFIAPYMVAPGESVSIELDCAADQLVEGAPCEAAVSFAGFTSTIGEDA